MRDFLDAAPVCTQDPSLRLKNGCAQDDAPENWLILFSKPSHYISPHTWTFLAPLPIMKRFNHLGDATECRSN